MYPSTRLTEEAAADAEHRAVDPSGGAGSLPDGTGGDISSSDLRLSSGGFRSKQTAFHCVIGTTKAPPAP